MPKGNSTDKPIPKTTGKAKLAKVAVLERTGLLWAIDKEGGLQILNAEESVATHVDYFGLYWNAKLGPKKVNGKTAPVNTHTHTTRDVRACDLCVFHSCAHTRVCALSLYTMCCVCIRATPHRNWP